MTELMFEKQKKEKQIILDVKKLNDEKKLNAEKAAEEKKSKKKTKIEKKKKRKRKKSSSSSSSSSSDEKLKSGLFKMKSTICAYLEQTEMLVETLVFDNLNCF